MLWLPEGFDSMSHARQRGSSGGWGLACFQLGHRPPTNANPTYRTCYLRVTFVGHAFSSLQAWQDLGADDA
jgi:hypothetical protein